MSNKFKDINIKNQAYYFFDDVINKKIEIKLKQMESQTKISAFTTLDM